MTEYSKSRPALRVTTELTVVKVIGEPYVAYTKFGYAPFLTCEDIYSGEEFTLKIQAVSLADALEERRQNSANQKFDGMVFGLRRASNSQKAPYIVTDAD